MNEDKVLDEFLEWATGHGNLDRPFFENDDGKWKYEPFSDFFVSTAATGGVKVATVAEREAFFIVVRVDIKRGSSVHRLETKVDLLTLSGFDTVRDCARVFRYKAIHGLCHGKSSVVNMGYKEGTTVREPFDGLPSPIASPHRAVDLYEAASRLSGRRESGTVPAHRDDEDTYEPVAVVPMTEFSEEVVKEP